MSLRKALALLPDDRGTATVVREVLAFFDSHPDTDIEPERVMHATGLPPIRVEPVLKTLAETLVLDCDGEPALKSCRYHPDSVLSLEVSRYLRVQSGSSSQLQSSVDRFRGRHGLF